jgi:hypothetical protein
MEGRQMGSIEDILLLSKHPDAAVQLQAEALHKRYSNWMVSLQVAPRVGVVEEAASSRKPLPAGAVTTVFFVMEGSKKFKMKIPTALVLFELLQHLKQRDGRAEKLDGYYVEEHIEPEALARALFEPLLPHPQGKEGTLEAIVKSDLVGSTLTSFLVHCKLKIDHFIKDLDEGLVLELPPLEMPRKRQAAGLPAMRSSKVGLEVFFFRS